jgi:hypothetical protein
MQQAWLSAAVADGRWCCNLSAVVQQGQPDPAVEWHAWRMHGYMDACTLVVWSGLSVGQSLAAGLAATDHKVVYSLVVPLPK